MVFEAVANLDLALIVLVALAFAQYAKLGKGLEKPFAWIAAGAFLALVAVAFEVLQSGLALWGATVSGVVWLVALFQVLAFIALLVGALWAAVKLLQQ